MNRLKELRKALGLKQREVAERLGVDVGLIGSWEIGRPIPKVRKYQICKEYNVRREWLETGEGEMFEPKKDDFEARFVETMLRQYFLMDTDTKKKWRALAERILAEPKN